MASLIGRARARKHEAITALATVATVAGLAATPATASAAAQHSSAANATQPAVGAPGQFGPSWRYWSSGQTARAGSARELDNWDGSGAYGRPVAGACVTAVGSTGRVTASARRSGTFTIGGLAAGSYALEYRDCASGNRYRAIWSGAAGWQQTAARVRVGMGQVRHVPVMMMPPVNPAAALQSAATTWHRVLANASGRGLTAAAAAKAGQISGVVTGKGKKLSGVCIIAFPVNGGEGYGAATGKNGSYVVRYVPPGRYQVTFASDLCGSRALCDAHAGWGQRPVRGAIDTWPVDAAA